MSDDYLWAFDHVSVADERMFFWVLSHWREHDWQ